ncbi:MAG: SDR family NAD(P)-dependent oxidoreductase [bacterium]|nr:SDR family NAD(P)-dependent oxidoreductase [bacterium]
MKNFRDKIAVITGAGTGMGRQLALQLVAEGCHVALCDVIVENLEETQRLCEKSALDGVRVSIHECDVSDESQMQKFRDGVLERHDTDHINLLFNNAGISGGGSFLNDDRADWDRAFGVCWNGVYFGSRAFLPLLVASSEGHIINTSSVNGFWASLGPGIPHTAYSAAKFAVKGFTEALLTDLKLNAPHVKASLVIPGHIGTSIAINSGRVLGKPGALEMESEDLDVVRERMKQRGISPDAFSDEQLRQLAHQMTIDFRDNAPVSAAEAATIILDGVRAEKWRILVGEDAHALDRIVREDPEGAYDGSLWDRIQEEGHLKIDLETGE